MISVLTKRNNASPVLTALFILIHLSAFSQKKAKVIYPDSLTLYKKANDLQFANYIPKNGKDGKDNISLLLEILSLGSLSSDGKNGKAGPNLKVMVSRVQLFNEAYLALRILKPKTHLTDTFYVNPYKGQIKILADGSDGGMGGESDNGSKGQQGKAGKGGSIEVILDSSAAEFIRCHCLLFSNKDGQGSDSVYDKTDEVLLKNGELLRPNDTQVKWTIIK